MTLIIHCSHSDAGSRPGNEDCHGEWVFRADHGRFTLLAVADGLGGHPAGDIASRLAIGTLHHSVRNSISILAPGFRENLSDIINNGFYSAAREVYHKQKAVPEWHGMGTTLTAALLDETGEGTIAHAGDSRAYLVTGSIRQITRDNSFVQDIADEGLVSQTQVNRHPLHNRLTKALGMPVCNPDLYQVSLGTGTLIICSDGLVEGLTDEEIAGVYNKSPFPASCQELIHAAKMKSRDNITVVAAKVKTP